MFHLGWISGAAPNCMELELGPDLWHTTLYFSEEPPKHNLLLLSQWKHVFSGHECLCYCRHTHTHKHKYSSLFLVTVFRSGHISATQLVPKCQNSQLRCWDFSSSRTSSFGRLGFVQVLRHSTRTDTQKRQGRGHRSGELNNGLWKLEIHLKWEAISSTPLVNVIKRRSYNLWISVEREAVECSRLSGKGYRVWKWGFDARWEAESAGVFHLAGDQQLLLADSSWRDEISSGRKGTDTQPAEADEFPRRRKMQSR